MTSPVTGSGAHIGATVLRPLYTKGFQLTALLMPIRAEVFEYE